MLGARRRALVAVAAASILLALAGCGSARKPSTSATASPGIAYADCMRSHGVTRFPDPGTNGRISRVKLGSSGISASSVALRAADSACSKLLPQGSAGARSSAAGERAALLAISRCMRAHGVSAFPDPTTGPPPSNPSGDVAVGGGVFIEVPSAIDAGSPAFKRAASTCRFGPHPLP